MGGGADWVDWYTTRLDGRSFQFHMWYYHALLRFASLHDEFAASTSDPAFSADTAEADLGRGLSAVTTLGV